MQTIKPVPGQKGITAFQQTQSISQALNSGIDIAYPQAIDMTGWPTLFTQANILCTLVRVGPMGSTPPSGYSWGAGVTKIAHNLGRLPIGFLLVYKNKTCDIFDDNTTVSDSQFIYLTNTDPTADTTVMVF